MPVAGSIAPLTMTTTRSCPRLTMRPVIGAAFPATVAVDADPGDPSGVLQPIPNEAREVFQGRPAERLDPVQQPMIKRLADRRHALLQNPEIQHHAGRRIGRAADGHFGTERMTVDRLAVHA